MRPTRSSGLAMLLVVAVLTLSAAPASAASLTVTPSSDLLDGDVIRVQAELEADTTRVAQCASVVDLGSFDSIAMWCRVLSNSNGVEFGSTIDEEFTVAGAFEAFFGNPVDCRAQACQISVFTTSIPGPRVSQAITFASQPDVVVQPSTGLVDGQTVALTTAAPLRTAPGAVAFSMQCGFTAGFSLHCGPLGMVISDFDGTYEGSLVVQRSFAGRGLEVECEVNAVCLVVTLAVSPMLEILSGDADLIRFAEPI